MTNQSTGNMGNVVTLLRPRQDAPFLLVCEHASAYIPPQFHHLGLDSDARTSHIAWDLGARAVTEMLSEALSTTAIISEISRLVYDCNRSPDTNTAIPERSELFDVFGNQGLTTADRKARVDQYYRPFERCVAETIAASSTAPILVTIHSFTPVYFGQQRQVQLGIIHDRDTRMADAMLACAGDHTSFTVERNQPYGPMDDGLTHTLTEHGLNNGLLNVMIEMRNDLIQTPQQQVAMTDILTRLLTSARHRLTAT